MRKTTLIIGGLFLVAGFAANAQEDAFHVRGDAGELVHVPTIANAHAQAQFAQPTDAPPTGFAVYPASYGSGKLTYRGGNVIKSAGVYSIFYDSSISATITSGINGFISSFGNSSDYNIITQYTGANGSISSTFSNAGQLVDSKGVPSKLSDSQIQSYIAGLMNAGRIPVSTSYVYGVYLPNGTRSTMQGGSSCTSYCGYHGHFVYNGKEIKYAVYPYPSCSGCSASGKSVLDMLTIITSHEIREAVTDPMEGGVSTWRDASGYEADDKCAWHNLYKTSAGYFVQPEFSNKDNGCVVP
jgi:hypothetical protein